MSWFLLNTSPTDTTACLQCCALTAACAAVFAAIGTQALLHECIQQFKTMEKGREAAKLTDPKMEWLLEGTALIVAASDVAGRTNEACRSPSRAGMASACLMASCNNMHSNVNQHSLPVAMQCVCSCAVSATSPEALVPRHQEPQLKHIW